MPAEATLGFVYASDTLAAELPQIVQRLQAVLPRVQWVGTLGMAVCASGEEYYDGPALVLLLGDVPVEQFRLLPSALQAEAVLPPELHAWAEQQGYCFALLHGDPTNAATPRLVEAVGAALPAAFINGGLTSSNGMHHQVVGDAVISGGVSGVLFGPAVAVVTDHTQGCTPLGRPHAITEAEGNIAIRLDHRPALEVMKEEIGEVLARDLQRIAGYIFVALPIAHADTGDYLVRHLMGLDTRNGLIAVGDYLDGHERLMFCRRDGNTAREDMRQMLARIKARVAGRTIRGGIYVTCLGRGRHQFGDDAEELRLIGAVLGEFPLAGFFANGELYNGRLYGYTGVLTLFL
ncbi:FIST signal transduction protein [Sulfurivermis fontis]|uniref:FIST signal transduction protein n=1 Tax=Sulfurivermis fontis TaxID=1972068 RepID=UPI001E56C0D6|nr:FIST N-terminal domain-containing protein [Sulfurivermis fontis]